MRELKLRVFSYVLILLAITYGTHQTTTDAIIEVLHHWTFPDFQYPSQQARTVAMNQQLFIPENTAILDTDYYFSNQTYTKRVFVTTPQFRNGIPATVSEVSREVNSRGEYLLKPFPSWDTVGSATSCEFARSVYRIHIDKCGLLWVLDTGRVNTFVNPSRECRPKLLIYDLRNGDTLIARYEFPDGTINDRSNLITLVTESYQDDCLDSIAYIADVNAYGLVVFDLPQRNSWRVDYNYFYPSQHAGTVTVAGTTFDLMDGVFGIALGPGDAYNRRLYFHSLASFRESWIPVSVLKNTTAVQNSDFLRTQMALSEEARTGQSSLEVMTSDGILLFSDLPKLAIMCWNSNTPFKRQNIHVAYQHEENLQFISGMKLKRDKALVITTSRLQNYIAGRSSLPDVKYRMIIIDDVHQLLKESPCKDPNASSRPSGGSPSNRPRPNAGQGYGQGGYSQGGYDTDNRFDSGPSSTTSSKTKPNQYSPPIWSNDKSTTRRRP